MRDSGAAAAQYASASYALGLGQLDQLGEVLDVDVLLGDGHKKRKDGGVEVAEVAEVPALSGTRSSRIT